LGSNARSLPEIEHRGGITLVVFVAIGLRRKDHGTATSALRTRISSQHSSQHLSRTLIATAGKQLWPDRWTRWTDAAAGAATDAAADSAWADTAADVAADSVQYRMLYGTIRNRRQVHRTNICDEGSHNGNSSTNVGVVNSSLIVGTPPHGNAGMRISHQPSAISVLPRMPLIIRTQAPRAKEPSRLCAKWKPSFNADRNQPFMKGEN